MRMRVCACHSHISDQTLYIHVQTSYNHFIVHRSSYSYINQCIHTTGLCVLVEGFHLFTL